MKLLLILLIIGVAVCGDAEAQTNVETIICFRHAEKPKGGLGQLTPYGLERAMALSKILPERYGKPQFIFACNPAEKVDETPPHVVEKGHENQYYYLRPLASVEPTAIACGLPVNIKFGLSEIKDLERELKKPAYQNATVYICWEHILLDDFAKNLVKHHGGDPATVPGWTNDNYEMIFVFKITNINGKEDFSFTVDQEGLDKTLPPR